MDGTGELLLLPKLVEKLKESGVDKKYFQPIISKSKKILGYTFITDNILPQKSYIDENYKFENQCEKCERINMTENENIFSDCRQSPGICRDFYYEHCFSGIIKLSERRCFL